MLSVIVNNIRLQLRKGTSVLVDYVSPLLSNGIEESQSDAYEVPTQGNEEALAHVGELSLADREVVFDKARTEHDGIPLNTGVVTVLASDSTSTRLGFQVDGFAELIAGLRLPDLLAGERIDLLEELNNGISFETRPGVTEGGNCQFPMFLAPNLHGNERPKWNPQPSSWNSASSYSENDLVSFTTYEPVERTAVYQCLTGGAGAGESPATHPAKWRRTSFALANAWDRVAGQHYLNTLSADFYSLVPWFYLKWVIRKALGAIGFTATGDVMNDPRLDVLLLPNTTSIDAARPSDPLYYFRATQNTTTPFVPNTLNIVRAQDETTAPNQDANSVWDPVNHRWTCPAAGTFTLRFAGTMNRYGTTPDSSWTPYTEAMLIDGTGAVVQTLELPSVLPWDLQRTATFTLTLGAGDVGRTFRCTMRQMARRLVAQPGGAIYSYTNLWPTVPSDVFTAATVDGWQNGAAPGVAVPDQYIQPDRHVPDVELGAFLLAIGDALNVEWVPDMAARKLQLNYKERVLERLEKNTSYHDHRLIGQVEQNFDRRVTGMRLRWDIDQADDVPDNASEYFTDEDLAVPQALGQWALLRSTREILKSAFRTDVGFFYWQVVGYYVPSVTVGDAQNPTEITPACKPVHMTQVMLDGKRYLVPVLKDAGTSAYYHNQGDRSTIWLCAYAPMKSSDGTVTGVPGARSWSYGWDSTDVVDSNLLLDSMDESAPGIFQRCWQSWMAMLTTAEAVTMDLLLDLPFIIGRQWHRAMHMLGQRYLVERLPVELHTDRRDLVSRGAYALRLRGYSPQPQRTVFVCAGPGYGSVTTNAGGSLVAMTEDGYATVRLASNGTLNTQADGYPMPLTGVSSYCLWASDAAGQVRNGLLELYNYDGGITGLYLEGLLELAFLDTLSAELSVLQLPPSGNLVILSAPSAQLVGLDLTGQTALWQIYATFGSQATALDFSDCLDMETIQITGENLANIVPPPNQTLRSVALVGALTSASVDAIINALDPTFSGIVCDLSGGTNAPRTSASDDNYNAVIANGGTILTN